MDFYDSLGKQYDELYGNHIGLRDTFSKWLHQLPPYACILDCGCGTGCPVAEMIVDSGRAVHGIDLSSTMIEVARKQVPGATFEVVSMLEYKPPLEGQMGGVVASLSLFELSRAQITTMAKRWMSWLRPGGSLLLVVMAAEKVPQITAADYDTDGLCVSDYSWKFGEGAATTRDLRVTLFTELGWKKLLGDVGFEVVCAEPCDFEPGGGCESETHLFLSAKKPLHAFS